MNTNKANKSGASSGGCCKYGCPDGKLFDETSETEFAEFGVEAGPHVITAYGLPEGEEVCIEVKICDKWYPWPCEGAQCKITPSCCELIVNRAGDYRAVLSDGAIGEAIVTNHLIDANVFDVSQTSGDAGFSYADICAIVELKLGAASADIHVTGHIPASGNGDWLTVLSDGSTISWKITAGDILALDADGNETTVQACLDAAKAAIADHDARLSTLEQEVGSTMSLSNDGCNWLHKRRDGTTDAVIANRNEDQAASFIATTGGEILQATGDVGVVTELTITNPSSCRNARYSVHFDNAGVSYRLLPDNGTSEVEVGYYFNEDGGADSRYSNAGTIAQGQTFPWIHSSGSVNTTRVGSLAPNQSKTFVSFARVDAADNAQDILVQRSFISALVTLQ